MSTTRQSGLASVGLVWGPRDCAPSWRRRAHAHFGRSLPTLSPRPSSPALVPPSVPLPLSVLSLGPVENASFSYPVDVPSAHSVPVVDKELVLVVVRTVVQGRRPPLRERLHTLVRPALVDPPGSGEEWGVFRGQRQSSWVACAELGVGWRVGRRPRRRQPAGVRGHKEASSVPRRGSKPAVHPRIVSAVVPFLYCRACLLGEKWNAGGLFSRGGGGKCGARERPS